MSERDSYLEPSEQLKLAAKVNRLCEVSPDQFGNEHLADAEEIVRTLNPRIEFRSPFAVTATLKSRRETKIHQAQTNLGNVGASFKEDVTRHIGLGSEREYRIGSYVAVKWKRWRNRCWFLFEHFFGRGEVNASLDIYEPITGILYDYNTLELLEIARLNAKVKRFGIFTFVGREKIKMWDRGKGQSVDIPPSTEK